MAPARRAIACALVGAFASCTPPPACALAIVDPADGAQLGPRDDVSSAIPGIQVNVTVDAGALPDGSAVQLTANGGAPSTGRVAGGIAVFSAFTIVPDGSGRCVLVATAAGCASAPVTVTLPVANLVVTIVGPPDHFVFAAADNDNPDAGDATFMRDVLVSTTASDGATVGLVVSGHAHRPQKVASGQARFALVVFPPGAVSLVATVFDAFGNASSSTVDGTVNTHPPPCDLAGFKNGVATVKGFATPVLNQSVDDDPKTPGEQVTPIATAPPAGGATLTVGGMAMASATADGSGAVPFGESTLPEGDVVLQLCCVDQAGQTVQSPELALLVDSIAPECALAAPAAHALVEPGQDVDGAQPGVQIVARVTSPSPDAEGQPVSFGVNGVDQGAPAVAIAGGAASHEVTLTAPGADTDDVTATVADAAANFCTASVTVGLDAGGCALRFLRPLPVPPPHHALIRVQDDTEPPIADGLQYDVALAVDKACIGRLVRFTVEGRAILPDGVVVADNGQKLGARVDFPSALVCPPGPNGAPPACDGVANFFAEVTDGQGAQTGAQLAVQVSAVPPTIAIAPAPPAMLPPFTCGATLSAAYDVDDKTPGVQIVMAATTSGRLELMRVLSSSGELTYPPQSFGAALSTVTLQEGWNELRGTAVDDAGNEADSDPCDLVVQGIAVAISSPIGGAFVPASGATVSGTVGVAGAAMTLSVDDAETAMVNAVGNQWTFANVTLEPGMRVLRVDAAAGGHAGAATVTVTADGSPPSTVSDLAAAAVGRARATLTLTAPSDDHPPAASYDLRWSTAPIDAQAFAQATSAAAPAPLAPGAQQSFPVDKLLPGVAAYFALVAADRAGNRSALSNSATATPTFARALVAPPADGELSGKRAFGAAAAGGDFNGDGFADLAVGAPNAGFSAIASGEGAVYVWYGSANGFAQSPDLALRGAPGTHAGSALAAADANGDGKADLAVGAPDTRVADKNANPVAVGAVYLLLGGGNGLQPAMAPRALAQAADAAWSGDPDDASAMNGRLGASLAFARFDGDALADLAIGAPGWSAGAGGAIVVAGAAPPPPSLRLPKDVLALAARGWRLGCANFANASGYGDLVADGGRLQLNGASDAVAVSSTANARVALFVAPMSGVDLDGATTALALLADSGAPGLGGAVAPAPDSDGNGFGELLLGEPAAAAGAGRIVRVDGSRLPGGGASLDVSTAIAWSYAGAPSDAAGASLLSPLDINGDASLDLLFTDGGHGGRLRALYAPANATFAAPPGAQAAKTVILVGDSDKDGFPDFALLDPTQNNGAGRIELYR